MPISIPNFAVCEVTGKYQARHALTEKQIINAAKRLLDGRVCRGITLPCSSSVKDYLITHFAGYRSEAFVCLFLDIKNRLLKSEEMFHGTIDQSAVYGREIALRCLDLDASGVIFAHNHPSGAVVPSQADLLLTQHLKKVILLVGAKALDHVIVGGGQTYSFAEAGLMN